LSFFQFTQSDHATEKNPACQRAERPVDPKGLIAVENGSEPRYSRLETTHFDHQNLLLLFIEPVTNLRRGLSYHNHLGTAYWTCSKLSEEEGCALSRTATKTGPTIAILLHRNVSKYWAEFLYVSAILNTSIIIVTIVRPMLRL
jgi:hypothetical protein